MLWEQQWLPSLFPSHTFQKLESSRKMVSSPWDQCCLSSDLWLSSRPAQSCLSHKAGDKVSSKVTISSVCPNSTSLLYYLETRADPSNKCWIKHAFKYLVLPLLLLLFSRVKPRVADSRRDKLFANREFPGKRHKIYMNFVCYLEWPASHFVKRRWNKYCRSTWPGSRELILCQLAKPVADSIDLRGSRKGKQTQVLSKSNPQVCTK